MRLAIVAAAAFTINGAMAHAATTAHDNDQFAASTDIQSLMQAPDCQAQNPNDATACQARQACLTSGTQDQACVAYCTDFSTDNVCQSVGVEMSRGWWGHGGWGWRRWCRWHPLAPRCRF